MTDIPGSVPVHVRCGCPDRRVPIHLTVGTLEVLARARLAPEFIVGTFRCRVCRIVAPIRVVDLPLVRLAS